MSSTSVQNEMRDSATGVTTRSRRRLRDEAGASSPSGDLHDRKKPKLQPPSVPLRRSPRHAARVASKAEIQNPPTRHPEPGFKTPSTSRSTSLVEENSEPAQASSSSHTASGHATSDVRRSDRRIVSGARTVSTLPLPQDVDIIDLTDSRTALKRKRSTVISDELVPVDSEDQVAPDAIIRVTRSVKKKSRLYESSIDDAVTGGSSALPTHVSRRRNSKVVADAPVISNELSNASVQSLGLSEANSNEVRAAEEEPQNSEVDPPQCAHLQETPEEFVSANSSLTSSNGTTISPEDSQSSRPAQTPISVSSDAEEESSSPQPTPLDEDAYQPSLQEVAYQNMALCGEPSTGETEVRLDDNCTADSSNMIATSSTSSSASQMAERPRSPKPRYFGGDGRLWRSRKPPSSYLAPNPVRRAPRNSTARRDEVRYLAFAAERAGLLAFAQTRRQFPRWMPRPSRVYFRGSEFFPRGQPATAQDLVSEEIGVGMDIDGLLASSSSQEVFPYPFAQSQLYPSTSSYTTPHMELDPDLDPSSLLNGQSSFYAHGTVTDFLGSGPGPSSTPFYFSGGPFRQTQEQFWPNQGTSSQMQQPFASGSTLAGPPSGSTSTLQASGSGVPLGAARGDPQELLPWDPTTWAETPQFSLFGIAPLPLPAQNMSLDSSLSAMATYLVNESTPLPAKTNLDSTTLNLIDGIPPTAPPPQSYLAAHPPMQQMDSNSTGDGYHLSPLN